MEIGLMWPALIILLAIISGYFSMMEIALIECHRGRLEKIAEDDLNLEKILDIVESSTSLNCAQVGITSCSLLAGICAVLSTSVISNHLSLVNPAQIIFITFAIIITTFIFLLFGEFIPKQIAKRDPETFLINHYKFFKFIISLINPFVILLSSLSRGISSIFGVHDNSNNEAVTEDEVLDLLEQGTEDGTIEKSEQEMVGRIFDIGDETAYSLMTPRVKIVWLDLADELEKNLQRIQENSCRIFPVGFESLDDCRGLIYAKDLLHAVLKDGKNIDLNSLIKKAAYVPRTMEALRIVEKFNSNGINEALVLDEYGGVIGLITLNDILHEIVTPSTDELGEQKIKRNKDNSWTVDGLCDIDEFKDKFDIEFLPEEEHDHFKTMGGFITTLFGYIPKVGEEREWNEFRFKVVQMIGLRIGKILITKIGDKNLSEENH